MSKLRFFSTLVLMCMSIVSVAATTTDSIATLELELKKNPEQRIVRQNLGQLYLKSGNYNKAIQVLGPYSNEISQDALIDLAMAYDKINDSENEIRILQFMTEKFNDKFRPYYLLGVAYKKNKNWDQATINLRKSIALAPKHRPSYEALLEIFSTTKNNYESRSILSDMIKNFGEQAEFLSGLCRLYVIDNFLDQALDVCKRAIRKNRKIPENHIYLAQSYYNSNNKTAAEKIFKIAAQQFKNSEFAQFATGEFYLNEKNSLTAVRYLEAAAKLNPKTLRSQYTLAIALFESKDYTNALLHFVEACKYDLSKSTITALRNSAAKIRATKPSIAEQYDNKAAVCAPLKQPKKY